MKKIFRGLMCMSVSLTFLTACNSSNAVVGEWKPIEDQCEYDDIVRVKFTNENTVQMFTDDDKTFGGEYNKNDDDIYTLNVNNIAMTATLKTKDNQTTLDIVGGADGAEVCTYQKVK